MKLRFGTSMAVAALAALALLMSPGDGFAQSRRASAAPAVVAAYIEEQQDVQLERAQKKIEEAVARAQRQYEKALASYDFEKLARQLEQSARTMAENARWKEQLERSLAQLETHVPEFEGHLSRALDQAVTPQILITDSGSGYLGVQISEVTAEKVKELKLSAERGVLVNLVEADSPAAKAGLKANDVIIEFNGQRVEGTVQFRRMVGETPSGRTVQLTVWREGRTQQISVQLGDRRDQLTGRVSVFGPRDFDLRMTLPRIAAVIGTPRLGISGEDLSGQLGNYFGVPEGKGVLVREVTSGSPAEKAGIKAGDVITKIDGERVTSLNEMRDKLRDKREKKTVGVTVIRKGTETSLNVELEQPKLPERRTISRRFKL